MVTQLSEVEGAAAIILRLALFLMNAAISLDDDFSLDADEVYDVTTDGMLAAEFTSRALAPQHSSKSSFRRSQIFAILAGINL